MKKTSKMKSTLTLLVNAALLLVGMSAHAIPRKDTSEIDRFVYRQVDGRIEKLQVHHKILIDIDSTIVDSSSIIPVGADTAWSINIMNSGGGEMNIRYKPVWYKNPFWFVYKKAELSFDKQVFSKNGWVSEASLVQVQHPFGFWCCVVFGSFGFGLIIGVVVLFVEAIRKGSASYKRTFFYLSIPTSLLMAWMFVPHQYFYPQYGLHLTKLEVYKHYAFTPFACMLVLNILYAIHRWYISLDNGKDSLNSDDLSITPVVE